MVDESLLKDKHSVLMLHGFMMDSSDWLSSGFEGESKAIPYRLLDDTNQYDVWVMNIRCNQQSREHEWLSPDSDKEFWNHTMDEIATYDIKANIEFI